MAAGKASVTNAVRSALDLERAYINGGKRDFLVGLDPRVLTRVLQPMVVDAAIARPCLPSCLRHA